MSENSVGMICISAVLLAMASCTYGVSKANSDAELAQATQCWDVGGSWETGWFGKWCNLTLPTPPQDSEAVKP